MPKIGDFYPTFKEASNSFQRIILKNKINKNEIGTGFIFYLEYYKEDPHLPSTPQARYNEDWEKNGGWKGFFQINPGEIEIYSFEEAAKAIQRLRPVPRGVNEYSRLHNQDPRLPPVPKKHYDKFKEDGKNFKELGGWDAYLLLAEIYKNKNSRFYGSAQEAREAVRKLGIINEEAYRTGYWRDSRLPPNLRVYYGRFTFLKVFGSVKKFT